MIQISERSFTCEPIPPIIRPQKCVVYNCKCDLCDAEYVGYTSRHLRIDEHRYSAIGKHLKNDHDLETIGGLTNNFSVLKKCNRKLDCLIYETFNIHKEEKAMLEHTIRPQTRKTIYLNFVAFYMHILRFITVAHICNAQITISVRKY